jgi:hypothetical protein
MRAASINFIADDTGAITRSARPIEDARGGAARNSHDARFAFGI